MTGPGADAVAQTVCGHLLLSTIRYRDGVYETVLFDERPEMMSERLFEHVYPQGWTYEDVVDAHTWLSGQMAHTTDLEVPTCLRCGDSGEIPHPAYGARTCPDPSVCCPTCGGV